MGGYGSGGANKKPIETHLLRNSFRADRHGSRLPAAPAAPLTRADRTRVLTGLSVGARRLAAALLDGFDGWDPTSLNTLRAYVLSCERLEVLQGAPPDDRRGLHAEIRANLGLLKQLGLERPE